MPRSRDLALLGAAIALFGVGCWLFAARDAFDAPPPPVAAVRGDPPEQPPDNPASFRFQNPVAELGPIKAATSHEFGYENRGTEPVTIGVTRASCGCVYVDRAARTVPPGGSGRLTVSVDPSRLPVGPQTKTIEVEVKGAVAESARLELRFSNSPDLVAPERVELRTVAGQPGTARFDLIDYRARPLRITQLACSPHPGLQAKVVGEPGNYLPGWKYQIEVTSAAATPPGDHPGYVVVSTDDPAYATIRIAVDAHHAPRLRAAPTAVQLLRAADGKVTGRVFISDALSQAVEIESLAPSDGRLVCELEPKTPGPRVVAIRYEETSPAGPSTPLSVQIKVNSPVREVMTVEVRPCAP